MNKRRHTPPGPVHRSTDDPPEYSAGIALLIERVRMMNEAHWSPTPLSRQADALSVRLSKLADYLACHGNLQFNLEVLHDRAPPPVTDEKGRSRPDHEAESMQCSYKVTIMRIRQLAGSARTVKAELPNPRHKPALEFAVMRFLHLRCEYGFPRPSLYSAGPAVAALADLLKQAGIHLSPETVRNALRAGLNEFDPC